MSFHKIVISEPKRKDCTCTCNHIYDELLKIAEMFKEREKYYISKGKWKLSYKMVEARSSIFNTCAMINQNNMNDLKIYYFKSTMNMSHVDVLKNIYIIDNKNNEETIEIRNNIKSLLKKANDKLVELLRNDGNCKE